MRAYLFYFYHAGHPLCANGSSVTDAWRNLVKEYGARVVFAQLKDVQVL